MVVVLLIYVYTKLYLEYYFRLLLNVYNMEAINIFKKIIIIILIFYLSPPWQIPNSTTTDLPKKKNSWSCHWWPTHIPSKWSSDEMLSIANIGFAWLHSTSTISYYNTSFFNNYLNGHCIYKNIKILEKFCLKNAIFSLLFSLKIKEI